MSQQPFPLIAQQAIAFIDKLQAVGLSGPQNIEKIETCVNELCVLSPQLRAVHERSIQTILQILQKIKDRLQEEGSIPIRMFSTWKAQLFVLKENLRDSK